MIVEATKRCTKCKRTLPVSSFYARSQTSDGLEYQCKQCRKNRRKRWFSSPENKARQRQYNVQYKYGTDEFLANRLLQVPVCQACGEHLYDGERSGQRIDHCHKNGHIRGVLCQRCNTAASGTSEEAIPRLLSLIAYLERDLEWQSL